MANDPAQRPEISLGCFFERIPLLVGQPASPLATLLGLGAVGGSM